MADDWYKPGSRLKLQYFEATDGTKTFTNVWDSTRGEACYFGPHADGSTRCMPIAGGTSSIFSDAGCSAPLVLTVKGQTPPKYAYPVALGARRYPTVTHAGAVYYGSPASCLSATAIYPAASWDFYALGAEIASTSFVEAALKTSP